MHRFAASLTHPPHNLLDHDHDHDHEQHPPRHQTYTTLPSQPLDQLELSNCQQQTALSRVARQLIPLRRRSRPHRLDTPSPT
jgi:hypothetical protein